MIIIENTTEEHAIVARVAPQWHRHPDLRNATLFGRHITGGGDIARYNIRDHYFIVLHYADHREGKPSPAYGLYEDRNIRLAFQYIEAERLTSRSSRGQPSRRTAHDR